MMTRFRVFHKFGYRKCLAALLSAGALALLVHGLVRFQARHLFHMPIAFTFSQDRLFVLEKKRNTLLELDYHTDSTTLRLVRKSTIEPDDSDHYYMVRKLYPGPAGLVVQSYIYRHDTRSLAGYRFREYPADRSEPRDLLTWWLPEKHNFPEIKYAFEPSGAPVFVHSCQQHRLIWRLLKPGAVVERDAVLPPEIQAIGPTNEPLAAWAAIAVDARTNFYLSSQTSDQVIRFSTQGEEIGRLGHVGFEAGDLLSPKELSFLKQAESDDELLTVASAGNRTWVQLGASGDVVRLFSPLDSGYPHQDVLVSEMSADSQTGELLSFDLANRCMIRVSRNFGIADGFTACDPQCLAAHLAAAACLFALAAWLWRARDPSSLKLRFFLKLLALFIPLLAASSLTVGIWVMKDMQRYLAREYTKRSANLARAIINHLSLDDLQAIQRPEDRNSEPYRRIHEMVNAMVDRERVPQSPKWILHKLREGRLYFGINIWGGALYEPYVLPPDRELFHRVLQTKKPDSGTFVDDQGEWFSYLEPILDEQGRLIYLLELYRDTEEMERANREALSHIISIIAATVLVSSAILLVFSFLITRPLKRLNLAAGLVSKGDFDLRVHVHSLDEIGDLGRSFNKMVGDLKQYTIDLERSTAERERMIADMRLAREVQQGILPASFPPMPGLEYIRIVARMEPAKEVCGDFYDFFKVDNDHVGVVIADVSGKGVPAGLFMMVARTLLKGNARHNLSPAQAIGWTNRIMATVNPSCMFVTMFYFIYNRRTREVRYCNAGHNPPLILRDGQPAELMSFGPENAHTSIVGVDLDTHFADSSLTLMPGDRLLLYTDGVVEPINQQGVMYGTERLIPFINRRLDFPDTELCSAILTDVLDYQQGLEQFDDITLLSFRPLM